MNKKIIIGLVCFLVVGIVLGYLFLYDKAATTITIDINPSIEIKLDKNDNVISVKALNDDAEKIVVDNVNGKSFVEALSVITDNLLENGYVTDDIPVVLIYSTGNMDKKELEDNVNFIFNNKDLDVNVIVIESVSKEDEKLAKKYNITPSKAAYINSITESNENIDVENLVEKSVSELEETKNTGFYCDSGYILDGSRCFKEVGREKPINGDYCPRGYDEYEGKCYESAGILDTGNLFCNEGFKLVGTSCVLEEVIDAEAQYHCDKGEIHRKGDLFTIGGIPNADKYYCVDKSTGVAPTLRCLKNPGHIMIGGKCYNGPAPLINGGCPNGDKPVNGSCYSLDNEDQWVCPNGSIYEKSKGTYVDLCPDTFTYIEPTITGYKCPEGFEVSDKKCIKNNIEEAFKERECPSGYTRVEGDACINKNNVQSKLHGTVCEHHDSRLINNECIIYDAVEAHHN